MKKFDLKAALNGEPVKLRGGFKAIVYYRVPDEFSYTGGSTEPYPLIGIVFNKDGTVKSASENWKDCGAYTVNQGDLDIVGMWEEPKKQTKNILVLKIYLNRLSLKMVISIFTLAKMGLSTLLFVRLMTVILGLLKMDNAFAQNKMLKNGLIL